MFALYSFWEPLENFEIHVFIYNYTVISYSYGYSLMTSAIVHCFVNFARCVLL